MMDPDDMSPRALSEWMARDNAPPTGIRDAIDFNGLARIPHFARDLLAVA
jgi:hypothetical protein